MPAPAFLDKLPRPAVFALYGALAGLLAALTAGELAWHLLRPSPPGAEAHTAPPAPKPASVALAVGISQKVQIYPGGTNFITVRVVRGWPEYSVRVKFTSEVGLSAPELTLPPAEAVEDGEPAATEVIKHVEIAASPDLKPGVYKLAVTYFANTGRSFIETLTPRIVEVTVLPLPPPPPRLAVSVSPKVQAYQRGKNTFAVRVARGEFDADVVVSFDGLPAGVTAPEVVIPGGKSGAVAEVTAEGSTKTGLHPFTATARAKQGGAFAAAEASLEVLGSPKLPVDVVFVLDCTGSMRKAVEGIEAGLARFGTELEKAQLEPWFGLVGFQDRTLGQMLQVPQFDDEPMTPDLGKLRTAVGALKVGGGGGEGDSSLDGIAKAADSPFRESVSRVILLVTDGAPKKVDWRVKSMAEMVKHLKEKKIDQLHVASLPEHRKAFEPLWEGAKGKYLALAAANMNGDYDKLMADFGRLVWESLPVRPENKPAASGAAAEPVLPPVATVKPPALPPGAEPDEPKVEKPAAAEAAEAPELRAPSNARRIFGAVAWAVAVVVLVCGALYLGQRTFLPGEVSPPARYGVGLVVGLVAGAVGYFALGAVSGGLPARLAGGCGFGLGFGLLLPLRGTLRREGAPAQQKPLELDDAPEHAVPAVTVKPAISPPKPRDGCPGCGRAIPGSPGARYCMLCDKTF